MPERSTIHDVAKACGVNVSTVSRCLNGKGRINAGTRDRILAAARSLDYRPNRIARGLVTGRTHTLGLIVSDIRNPFFAEVARGVEDAANHAGCDVVLCNTDLHQEKQLRYIRSLVEKGVDGIIINFASAMNREQEQFLRTCGVPVVLLNRPSKAVKLSTVSIDNRQGGFLAATFLLKLGHRSLAVLGGPEDQSNHAARAAGFLGAVKASGRNVKTHVLHGSQNFAGGYEMTWRLLTEHADVTAIFTGNDVMAFGALRALTESGRRVPEDVSLVGFDNIEMSGMIQTPLTTIEQPKYEIGKCAVEILLGPQSAPVHREFGVKLVERQSTRPLKAETYIPTRAWSR